MGVGSLGLHLLVLDLLHLATEDLALGDRDLLLARLPRLGAAEELPRPLAGEDDEFKPVVFRCALHGPRVAFP